jgi:peptide/nickel transport system substrate-binding protein
MRRLLIAGAAALLVMGFSPVSTGAQTPEKTVLTIGSVNEPDSLNPLVGVEVPSYFVWSMTYDLLINFGQKDLSPSPGLAESWEVSTDGLTWTYHIRSGAVWQDGLPVTAQDVAYTYNRVITDNIGNYAAYLDGVTSVTAPDDNTVVITTSAPRPKLAAIYIYILPEHIWKDIDKKTAKTFENVPAIGSGPYDLVEWQKGQFVRLEANTQYWGGQPHVDEVIYRIFNNEDALVQALKSGEVDYADQLSANLYKSLEGADGITQHAGVVNSFDELGMNTGSASQAAGPNFQPHGDGHPALADVKVRQAIAMAIDKQELVDKVLLGYGAVGDTIVTPVSGFWKYQVPDDEAFAFDLAKANQTLEDAGYKDTDGDGIREMPGGGRALSFRYFVRTDEPNTVKAAQFIQGWLKEIGIDTQVQALSDNKLTDVIDAGNYDLFHWGWFPDPDPDYILGVMTCDQRPPNGTDYGNNDSYHCDPAYDQLYQQQASTVDTAARTQIVQQMEQMVYDDSPYVVLWYDNNLTAYRSDRFTGFLPQPEPDGDLLVDSFSNDSILSVRSTSEAVPTPTVIGSPGPTSAGTPPVSAGSSAHTKGLSVWVWIAIIGGAVIVIGGVIAIRKRSGQEERE